MCLERIYNGSSETLFFFALPFSLLLWWRKGIGKKSINDEKKLAFFCWLSPCNRSRRNGGNVHLFAEKKGKTLLGKRDGARRREDWQWISYDARRIPHRERWGRKKIIALSNGMIKTARSCRSFIKSVRHGSVSSSMKQQQQQKKRNVEKLNFI